MAKTKVVASALTGVVGGVAVGAMVGPVGVAVGLVLGVCVGAIAGRVMAREEAIADARTRELDAIIGVTEGRIGAAPLPPAVAEGADDWAAEWLTPPLTPR